MYKAVELSNEAARAIVYSSKDWVSFAENRHGGVYWNRTNGEIVWLAEKEGDSNYQQLVVDPT